MAKELISYNRTVILAVCESFYQRANSIVVTATVRGGLTGFGIGVLMVVVAAAASNRNGQSLDAAITLFALLIPTALGLAAGYSSGQKLAFEYKFEAQKLLCQVEIEKHLSAIRFSAPPPK